MTNGLELNAFIQPTQVRDFVPKWRRSVLVVGRGEYLIKESGKSESNEVGSLHHTKLSFMWVKGQYGEKELE